jgi:hypothetical protein
MSESQRLRAVEALYANSDLRSELTDDEAAPLLQWGEGQVAALAGRELDDAAFDQSFSHLQAVMARLNRYVGGQSYLPPAELQTLLDEMAAEAQHLGADVLPGGIVLAQSAVESGNIGAIRALTGLLTPRNDLPPMPPDLPEWPDSHG